jgi:RimJ/RimL family protein N-acetyltransferase
LSEGGAILFIEGERVGLGELRRELVSLYHRWANDPVVQRTTRHPRLFSIEDVEAGFDHYMQSDRNQGFTIYERADDPGAARPVGTAGLKDIDHRNRTAEFEIVIGEPDARGRGYGTEATRLVLDYAFTVLGLRNVMLTVYANNPGGVRAYQKAGFREFGRRTGAVEVAGELFDVVYMECLAADFASPVLRAMFAPQSLA